MDAGLDGAAVLIDSGGAIVDKFIMPTIKVKTKRILDLRELSKWVYSKGMGADFREPEIKMCYLESVHSLPGNGSVSSFKFGYVFGATEMCLAAHSIPYTLVTPKTWQKKYHQGMSKDIDPKKRSILAFNRLYPGVDLRASDRCKLPHSGLVDALLIAEYGRLHNSTN